jgi:hypothetical protein
MQSMAALAMGNYAAHAIAAGLPDYGWEAVEKIYRARYERDGCPWDAPLQWSGEGNCMPQWGRWYMSHPASWYVLWALGGARIDRLRGSLQITPSWPTAWGDTVEALPVYLPGLRAQVDSYRGAGRWEVRFTIRQLVQPLELNTISTQLPRTIDPWRARVHSEGIDPQAITVQPSGLVVATWRQPLAHAGDSFTITVATEG